MTSLFSKLDNLSHLHFTPKQKTAEVKIVKNIPSISMEEVAPTAASDAALLAPAEVVNKEKGEMMAKEEKADTDRKRERREKKAKKRAAKKEKEKQAKLVEKLNPGLGNKYSKQKALKQLRESEKQGKVTRINEKDGNKSVKNSSAFFSQLQDEVKNHISDKSMKKTKANKEKQKTAASFKL